MIDIKTFVLRPPERQTLADSVTESLREAIFAGVFQTSERLAEAQLARRLQVSRAPIREALAALEQEGLVRRTSGGTTVSQLSREDAVEICTLRHALELLAMRLALGRPAEALCAALEENIERTRAATDPRDLARLDLEFHQILVRAAGHQRLLAEWLKLRSQIRLILTQRNLGDARSHEGTLRAHNELLDSIKARDIDRATSLLERQLQSQYAWIMRGFDDKQD